MAGSSNDRLHALDALRAVMMLLGVVLHGIISYATEPHGASWPLNFGEHAVNASWPYQDPRSIVFFDLLYDFIHLFRMPLFFLLSGFFGHLVVLKKGVGSFIDGRKRRILYPLLVFWPLLFPLVGGGMLFLMGGMGQGGGFKETDFLHQGNVASVISPLHLWFLYYLIFFYGAILLFDQVLKRFTLVQEAFAKSFNSSLAVVAPALLMGALLYLDGGKIAAAANFIPDLKAMSVYFVFYLFGWMLYPLKSEIRRFERQSILHLLLGVASFLWLQRLGKLEGSGELLVASLLGPFSVWCLIFAFMGLFLRFFSQSSPFMTYLSGSSYWLYLMHLPLVVWLVVGLKGLGWPSPVKALVVLSLTLGILLVAYEFGVRKTFIGRFLNGR